MNLSNAGRDAIKGYEGLRLTAYQDSVGVWTIGYGHTRGVSQGQTITLDEAERLLDGDLLPTVRAVAGMIRVPVTQGQFDALVSFAYNLGVNALRESTLLRLLNQSSYGDAADQFKLWVHAGGEILPGLVKRRASEAAMFRSG